MFLLPIGLNEIMRKIIYGLLLIALSISNVSAQTEKAEKIIEFGYEHCSQVLNHTLLALQETEKVSDAKLYVIYYQGKYITQSSWNNKLKKI